MKRKRKKNPSEREIRGSLKVHVEPITSRISRVIIMYNGKILIDKEMSASDAEILASRHGKERLAQKFAPILNQPIRNPRKATSRGASATAPSCAAPSPTTGACGPSPSSASSCARPASPTSASTSSASRSRTEPTGVGIGGIKLDPKAAYRLGYRKGMLDGLSKCGIADFFERQTLRKQLNKALDESLDEFHERITAAAAISRFPQIK